MRVYLLYQALTQTPGTEQGMADRSPALEEQKLLETAEEASRGEGCPGPASQGSLTTGLTPTQAMPVMPTGRGFPLLGPRTQGRHTQGPHAQETPSPDTQAWRELIKTACPPLGPDDAEQFSSSSGSKLTSITQLTKDLSGCFCKRPIHKPFGSVKLP